MQAVILAGGLATRLHPRTLTVPKAVIPVAGRPFVAWQLEAIARSGYERVLLLVGHLGEQIEEAVGDGKAFGLAVDYAYDGPKLLGTAGAIRRALERVEPTFLVTYGDSYLPFDYSAPLADLRAHPEALGTMCVYKNEGRWDQSNTRIEGELVTSYEKGTTDPDVDYIDYGASAFRREVFAELEPDQSIGLDRLVTNLARERRLRAFVARERFYEIGSEAGLSELEQRLVSK